MTRQDSPSPRCLDGETLAAWSSGSLRASEAAKVEEHLSNCERCQSMLATFVRIEPPPAASESVWRRWHLAWVVPVAAAATVTAIWVAIPTDRRDSLRQSARFEAQSPEVAQPQPQPVAPAPPPAAPPPAPQAAPRPASKPLRSDERARSTEKNESMLMKQGQRDSEEVAQKRPANEADRRASDSLGAAAASSPAPQAAAPPPPPPPALERHDEPAARQAREKAVVTRRDALADASTALIVSPVPSYRWRITGGRQVDRSSSGGEQWQRVAILDSERLTAGHSPSASVAWLVGPAGTIYVTSDGTRFEKIPFIEPVDLVGVVAIDDRQATVTAADGRGFQTMDRGVTWNRVP